MLTIERPGKDQPRDWKQAALRGMRCRCPQCNEGRIFGKFLKVKPACDACGEELHHHRADDLPPYLTMAIVGHIVIWMMLIGELDFDMPLWLHIVVWPLLTLVLSLALIQPIKGGVVGLQWALRMHGFGGVHDEEEVLRPRGAKEREA